MGRNSERCRVHDEPCVHDGALGRHRPRGARGPADHRLRDARARQRRAAEPVLADDEPGRAGRCGHRPRHDLGLSRPQRPAAPAPRPGPAEARRGGGSRDGRRRPSEPGADRKERRRAARLRRRRGQPVGRLPHPGRGLFGMARQPRPQRRHAGAAGSAHGHRHRLRAGLEVQGLLGAPGGARKLTPGSSTTRIAARGDASCASGKVLHARRRRASRSAASRSPGGWRTGRDCRETSARCRPCR